LLSIIFPFCQQKNKYHFCDINLITFIIIIVKFIIDLRTHNSLILTQAPNSPNILLLFFCHWKFLLSIWLTGIFSFSLVNSVNGSKSWNPPHACSLYFRKRWPQLLFTKKIFFFLFSVQFAVWHSQMSISKNWAMTKSN
jgi:hypothetical protein